jgi:hypothetical protein
MLLGGAARKCIRSLTGREYPYWAAKLAEHVARHPEDVGRTVEDFNWILWVVLKWPREAGDPPFPAAD